MELSRKNVNTLLNVLGNGLFILLLELISLYLPMSTIRLIPLIVVVYLVALCIIGIEVKV